MGDFRPVVFIGSSVRYLPIAHAIQENWHHTADARVWDQGIFEPSSTTLDSLIDTLDEVDFGVFVFGPEDLVKMRMSEHLVTRDNVVFELGMFIGRLGKRRSFIVMPHGVVDFKLPTDLLGITTADYMADRADKNPVSALGVACNKMLRVMQKLGGVHKVEEIEPEEAPSTDVEVLDDGDCVALLVGWLRNRNSDDVSQPIRFAELDRTLGMPSGATARLIAQAVPQCGLVVSHRGNNVITLDHDMTIGVGTISPFATPDVW